MEVQSDLLGLPEQDDVPALEPGGIEALPIPVYLQGAHLQPATGWDQSVHGQDDQIAALPGLVSLVDGHLEIVPLQPARRHDLLPVEGGIKTTILYFTP